MPKPDCRALVPLLCLLLLSAGCATLPPATGKPSHAFRDTAESRLGKAYSRLTKSHPNQSGFLLLTNGLDAFTARLVLALGADYSIDAQYYMIHNDLSGAIFTEQLLRAADRGIRVRLLIDDMDLEGRDEGLSALAAHPNISLRIFNPFSRHTFRASQLITRFGLVTRRMHNKSFTVDNQATIVGGRNIGNEYFDADPLLAFADLDLLAIGPVVGQVSSSFDEYWNSGLAYPIDDLRPDLVDKKALQEGRRQLTRYLERKSAPVYLQRLLNSDLATKIKENRVEYTWGTARVLSDHPDKLKSYDNLENFDLSSQIAPFFHRLHRELLIFSPYFVPGPLGTEWLSNLGRQGIRVRILTNSLASTDVGIVHAGYAKYRRDLLRAGIELYELDRTRNSNEDTDKKTGPGSSKASLHAKSFVLDRKQVFIGSLNLDPRSVRENTEIGIMVRSAEIADTMAAVFDHMVENSAYRLELKTDADGMEFLSWHGRENGKERTWTADPHTSLWERFTVFFLGLLPIESQL